MFIREFSFKSFTMWMLIVKRGWRVWCKWLLLFGWWFAPAFAEMREWQETVQLNNTACLVTFRADYLSDENAKKSLPWPFAFFSATSACFTSEWQSNAAMRVLTKTAHGFVTVDDALQCRQLNANTPGMSWQSCALNEVPLVGFYRNIWGPIRVASTELSGMHQEELSLFSRLRANGHYLHFTDTYSERLWLHRFCAKPSDIVHHFERWQACIATLETKWPAIFGSDASRPFDYPQFVEAKIINPP